MDDESFSTAATATVTATSSTSSFTGGGGYPNDNWTIEELLRWSLEQYRLKAIEQTSSSIASLRAQCEKECEEIMQLHRAALEMKQRTKEEEKCDIVAQKERQQQQEENRNPQIDQVQSKVMLSSSPLASFDHNYSAKKSTYTTTHHHTNAISTIPQISSTAIRDADVVSIITTTIEVQVISGPHVNTTYKLCPTTAIPCLVGRSKGKKFMKHGISLFKDQEVSTTHGKFILAEELFLPNGTSSSSILSERTCPSGEEEEEEGKNDRPAAVLAFYYIDVGSTNGTFINGGTLQPQQRLLLENDMELKLGNSVLKIHLRNN